MGAIQVGHLAILVIEEIVSWTIFDRIYVRFNSPIQDRSVRRLFRIKIVDFFSGMESGPAQVERLFEGIPNPELAALFFLMFRPEVLIDIYRSVGKEFGAFGLVFRKKLRFCSWRELRFRFEISDLF